MPRRVSVHVSLAALTTSLLTAVISLGTATPASAAVFADWATVSAGNLHTCGIRAGRLYCWGADGSGALGNGSGGSRTTPGQSTTATDWTSVSAGGAHTCAIRSVGKLYCWGNDGQGQLGNGSGGSSQSPIQITSATDWKSVSAGSSHTCAIRSTGKLYCWGYDFSGQLGNASGGSTTVPVQITTATDWKSVSAGSSHTCAIRSTGKLYCWGSDSGGQLGNGSGGSSQFAIQITTATDWKSVSAGGGHTCAIRSVGKLYCWGNDGPASDFDDGGALGNGAGGSSQVAMQITTATDWKIVTAGNTHTCAIRSVGKLYCWGNDKDGDIPGAGGQLGNGAGGSSEFPIQITSATDWKTVSAGSRHTCAIRSTGKLYCWGYDAHGQVGNGAGAGGLATQSPVQI